ncbi:hypothetical protein Mapa_003095 [Marchantia paleacea]|nr:hypothetical protein Mapa_003095 [Marchantia paleacea]
MVEEITDFLAKTIASYIEQLDVPPLIILDEVWEPRLIQKLIVAKSTCKYIATTERPGIFLASEVHLNENEVGFVPIQLPRFDEARRILVSSLELDESKTLSDGNQEEILDATNNNPMVLKNLSMYASRLYMAGRFSGKGSVWKEVRKQFWKQLGENSFPPYAYADDYPYGFAASMNLMFDTDLLLLTPHDQGEKILLYTIAMFDGPSVPEAVVEFIWNLVFAPKTEADFASLVTSLVTKTMIHSSSHMFPCSHQTLSIHHLRQDFILFSTDFNLVDLIAKSPMVDTGLNRVFALALCALYGERSTRDKAYQELSRSGFAAPAPAEEVLFFWRMWSTIVLVNGW